MRCSLLLCVASLAGCGPGVHDLSFIGQPIVTIRGRVNRDALLRAGGELHGGIAWAARPQGRHQACELETTNPNVIEICRAPTGFRFGELQSETVLLSEGLGMLEFEIEMFQLPNPAASFGPAHARIAYGSLIVFELADSDIDSTLLPVPDEELATVLPVAASYADADAYQQRLLFRDGGFDPANSAYPPMCDAPPAGYSILEVGPATVCSIRGLETHITSEPLTMEQGQRLVCPAGLGQGFVTRPEDGYPPDGTLECVNNDVLIAINEAGGLDSCTTYTVYALIGCVDDLECEMPEWDMRDNPPDWWPCS